MVNQNKLLASKAVLGVSRTAWWIEWGPASKQTPPVPLEIHGSPYVIKAHPLPCGMQKVPCILAWPGLFSLLQ